MNRRGSALLIVLGMLAFIVASAVAFSAYMRYARLPSSYLRRTSSSRLLVKAALAEAIDIVDTSIGNSTYAGKTGREFEKAYRRITDGETPDNVIDYWQDRCFIGSNRLVSVSDTVSTLCTEALAYIPPSLINEVRYYSRRSVGAMWHTLGYDSGRYAFAAVDVSDFFDVNSVCATPLDVSGQHMYGRNSSDSGRITLAHVFENAQHSGGGYAYQPDDWDDFMDNYLDSGKLPLVSIADLNLAMNKQGLPAYMSPFCNYIRNGENFVTAENGPEAQLVRNMTFVTDGIFAITNRVPTAIDLSRKSDQPFYGYERNATLLQLVNDIDNRFTKNLENRNSPLIYPSEFTQLYDYVDEDSVPSSLTLPTVERTPMITGLSLAGQLKVVVQAVPRTKSVDPNTQYTYTTYTLQLGGTLDVVVGSAFPFKYNHGSPGTFKAEAVATIAFVPSCSPEADGLLRCERAAAPGVITLENGDWSVNGSWATAGYAAGKPSVARCRSSVQGVALPSVVLKDEDAALDDVSLPFGALNGITFAAALPASDYCNNDGPCSFRSKAKRQIKDPQTGQFKDDPTFTDPTPLADRIGFLPVAQDLSGAIDVSGVAGQTFIPTVQVWVRIFRDSDTVDLVPACWKDDKTPCNLLSQAAPCAKQFPLIRFRGSSADDSGIRFVGDDELKLTGSGNVDPYPKAYLIDDPRFNFAPENFEIANPSGPFKSEWLTKARVSSAADDRDGDIFMATSDAGYLQSAYELAHILKVAENGLNSGFGVLGGGGYDGRAGGIPSRNAMWRTYSQYDSGSSFGDIDRLDIINGSRGFRVNPYTQSTEIMLAALANAPLDWWAASTNDTVNTTVHGSAANAAKYAFSEMGSSPVKLPHDKIETIAENMIAAFRNPDSSADWRQVFDDFGWDGDEGSLCGVALGNDVKLHSVDRKFLHGFWKESLANRQQLFLIFVRAEPMMMGGGGLGQTPPQLGGRAVALVWRDPTATRDDVSGLNTSGGPRPHRTRVLFYRQFD